MSVVVLCMEGAEFGIPSFVLVVGTTTFYRRGIVNDDQPIWTNNQKMVVIKSFRILKNTALSNWDYLIPFQRRATLRS